MNAISCIVVDDEPLAVRLMESYVAKTPFLSLKGSFTSGTAAFRTIRWICCSATSRCRT